MRRIPFIFLAGMLFVGAGTAAVTLVYGTVWGTVSVAGPVLYAGEDTTLRINEQPVSGSTYTVDGSGLAFDSEQFTSDHLDEPDFYPITATMTADARLNRSGSEPLDLMFGFYNSSGAYQLCSERVQVSGDTYQPYTASCDTGMHPAQVQQFYYRFEERTGTTNVSYKLRADGVTRVEVDAQ